MPFLSSIFPKKNLSDFSAISTDIHAHYIPGIDDGCKTMDESLRLLKIMYESGFRKIVCTPHIQDEYYRNRRENILPVFEELQEKASSEVQGLELFVAAEYLIDDGFPKRIQEGLLTFGKRKFVLVELSYFQPHPKFRNYLQDLLMKGFTPLMAHPERYGYWMYDDLAISELHAAGVGMQVNIPSLSGYYGSEIRKRAFDLIGKGLISYAGTDVHNDHYTSALLEGLKQKQIQNLLGHHSFKNSEVV